MLSEVSDLEHCLRQNRMLTTWPRVQADAESDTETNRRHAGRRASDEVSKGDEQYVPTANHCSGANPCPEAPLRLLSDAQPG